MSESDFSGFRRLMEDFRKLNDGFDDWLKSFLLEMALRALASIKKRQTQVKAVDTGAMRSAWALGEIIRNGDVLQVEVYNPVMYAAFVELGHATSDRNGWVEGRYIATIPLENLQKQIPARFEKAFSIWAGGLLK